MGSTKSAERNYHAKMYIDAVFAETLKKEGFVNPDGKSISWYRVVNHELVHAVYFHSSRGGIPIMGMYIESRVFPLFYKPRYYSTIYTPVSNRHIGYRTMTIKDLPDEHGMRYYCCYSDDILVYSIASGKKGLYTLEVDVLPWFQKAMTLADYYQLATEEVWNYSITFSGALLPDVATLVLYYGDTEKYKAYSKRLANAIPVWIGEKQEDLIAIKAAIDGGGREEFLHQLEQRKQKTIRWLKKMGIPTE